MLPYFIYITSSFLITPNLFSYMAPFKSTKPQGRLTTLLPTHHLKFYTPRYHIFLLTHFDTYKYFLKRTLTNLNGPPRCGAGELPGSGRFITQHAQNNTQHPKFHHIILKFDINPGPSENRSRISCMLTGFITRSSNIITCDVHCTAHQPALSS